MTECFLLIHCSAVDTPSVPDRRGHIGLRPVSEIRIHTLSLKCWINLVNAALSLPQLSLAERYRSIFKGFIYFNLVQSKVFDDVSSLIFQRRFSETGVIVNRPMYHGLL